MTEVKKIAEKLTGPQASALKKAVELRDNFGWSDILRPRASYATTYRLERLGLIFEYTRERSTDGTLPPRNYRVTQLGLAVARELEARDEGEAQ